MLAVHFYYRKLIWIMFKDNKYSQWYFQLMDRSFTRTLEGYTEKHHIIPKCLGGANERTNIAVLTAREHYIAHLLLTKMSDDHRLKFGFVAMTRINGRHERGYRITSYGYKYAKECNAKASSIRSKKHAGKHLIGRKMYHDPITGRRSSFHDDDPIPEGWVRGMGVRDKEKVGDSNRGRVYYHRGNEVVAVKDPSELDGDGWIKGNPNAATGKGKNYITSFDPRTGKEYHTEFMPEGNVRGRPIRFITNGTETKMINIITESVPDGWRFGRVIKRKKG